MWAEDREGIGVAADDDGVDGLIEWRLWGRGGLCDGFFDALFRQVCVSLTCREASLDHYCRTTSHADFDSRVLCVVFQGV
jgi:hypothetical protein